MALFSVCQFFVDDSYEYVRRGVGPEEALTAFRHYISSVGARLGTTRRVILTDDSDYIAAEWKWDEGITFGLPNHMGRFKHGLETEPPPQ